MSSVNYSLKHKGVRLISADNAWAKGKNGKQRLNSKYYFVGKIDTRLPNMIVTASDKDYSVVEDVTLLEMTFETEGDTYHLGVVDNEQTPDTVPDGDYGNIIEEVIEDVEKSLSELFSGMWTWLLCILLLVGFVIIIAVFAPWIFLLAGKGLLFIFKMIWRISFLPFKLLCKVFKGVGKLFNKK